MKIYLISILISILLMIFSGVIIFNIIDYLDPSVTEEGHRYMPAESLAKSLFLSAIIGAVAFISILRIQRQRLNK